MSEDFMMADFDATRSMTYRADFEVNPIGTADEIKRLRTEARAGYDVIAVVMGDGGHHREAVGMRRAADDAIARVVELRADLERERMRLAACGVVALADTPESARQAREMHEDYRSASCDDVARRVDECMRLRAELADAIKTIDRLHDERRKLMAECEALRKDAERWRYYRRLVEIGGAMYRVETRHRSTTADAQQDVWFEFDGWLLSTDPKDVEPLKSVDAVLDRAIASSAEEGSNPAQEGGWL